MCYPKPGPRCSSHAKKRYIMLRQKFQSMRGSFTWEEHNSMQEEVDAAELDFDSTPVGQARLELKIKQGDRRGEIKERLENARELRRLQLEAIKAQDLGDIRNHESNAQWVSKDFLTKRTHRKNWNSEKKKESLNAYIDFSDAVSQKLTPEEATALYWHTSDGSSTVNQYIHKELMKNKNTDTTSDKWHFKDLDEVTVFTSKYPKKMVANQLKTLDSIFAKHQLEEPVVLYRGIAKNTFPDELAHARGDDPLIKEYLDEKYPVGGEVEIPEYMSTSADPAIAHRFSGFQHIVVEIKTKSAIPVGMTSAWDASEREFIVNRNGKYRVVSRQENVTYKDVFNSKREKGPHNKNVTVIQLEEV